MINTETVKQMAKEMGADLVGIADMKRFEGMPKQFDPRYIFPEAKVMIVLAYRMPRGVFRGIEEGTYFSNYPSLGYAGMNVVYGPMVLWNLTRYIEDLGYDAVPIANINGGEAVNIFNGNFKTDWSVPVDPDKPYPDVLVNFRFSAYYAGLGEIGYSRLFLSPEFGPMNRFNIILTDAPLDPDPIYSGPPICDRCKQCVRNCPSGALSKTETDHVVLAGREFEFAKVDPYVCMEGIDGTLKEGISPFRQEVPSYYGYGRAVEGALGCVRACYTHLEERGKLTKKYHSKFRRKPLWHLTPGEVPPYSPHVVEEYFDKGKIETSAPSPSQDSIKREDKEKKPLSDITSPW